MKTERDTTKRINANKKQFIEVRNTYFKLVHQVRHHQRVAVLTGSGQTAFPVFLGHHFRNTLPYTLELSQICEILTCFTILLLAQCPKLLYGSPLWKVRRIYIFRYKRNSFVLQKVLDRLDIMASSEIRPE